MSKKPKIEPKVVENDDMLEIIDNFITQKYLTEELFDVKDMSFKKDLSNRLFELGGVTVDTLPEGGIAYCNPDDHEKFLIFLRKWSSRSVSWKSAYDSLHKYILGHIKMIKDEVCKNMNDPIAIVQTIKLLDDLYFNINYQANTIPNDHETIHDDAPMIVVKERYYIPTTKQINDVIDNAEIFIDDKKNELTNKKKIDKEAK